jgi:T5SS/PEP-CTERM-associated repeat protein
MRLALLVAAMLPALYAGAVPRQWTASAGSPAPWTTPGNWLPNGVPTANDAAVITNGGIAELTQAGQAALSVSLAASGVNRGSGTLRVLGSGELQLHETSSLYVGQHGTGTLEIRDGGEVTGGYGWIADQAGTIGTVTVDGEGFDGDSSQWTNSETLYVGRSGNGTLNLSNGGDVLAKATEIGSSDGSVGKIKMEHPGTNLRPGTLIVGRDGSARGELRIERGAAVDSGESILGFSQGSTGEVYVSASGPELRSTWLHNSLRVGASGTGRVDVTGGGYLGTRTSAIVGLSSNGLGVVNVDGTGSVWDVVELLDVGFFGYGTLNITNGGKVLVGKDIPNPPRADLHIARHPDVFPSTGVVTVDNSQLKVQGDIVVGNRGVGTLEVKNGALVNSQNGFLGLGTGSEGSVVVENAVWSNSEDIFVGGLGAGVIETRGTGRVNSSGSVTFLPRGDLKGTGKVVSPDVLNITGRVLPGLSAGTLTIEGNYTQGGGGLLQIELASPTSYDVLAVTGQATLDGTLEINLLDGYTPAPSHTFNFLTASSFTGNFSNVVVNTASGQGGSFDIDVTPTGLRLSNFDPDPGGGGGGLIAHWDAENGAMDATGNGHDGIFRGNAATTTAGPFGKAFTLDGDGDYIEIGDELDMGASDFTLAAWVNGARDPGMNEWGRILDKGYASGYELGRTGFAHTVGFTFLNSDPSFTSTSEVIDETWHHIAIVKSGTTATVYADGVAEGTVTVSAQAQDNALPLLIGYNPGEGLRGAWMGMLDELKIFDRALSPNEIAALATIPDELPGDFNRDGKVDAADYVVWRKNGMSQAEFNTWRANFGRMAAGTTIEGDFNSDGVVNGADYVVWRKTGGTQAQFNAWRANFGRTAGGGSGSGGDSPSQLNRVPEPSAILLAIIGLPAAGGRLTQRRRGAK